MEFNPDKCEILRVTRHKSPICFPYSLKGHQLKVASSTKYLGVDIHSGLQWNNHINTIANKASRTLGFIKRNVKTLFQGTRELAYKSLVRPTIEYASSVWSPEQKELKYVVERVQRRAARYVSRRYGWTDSVTDMLDKLSWETLEQRRKKARVVMMYRIIHGLVMIPDIQLIPIPVNTRDNSNEFRQ